MQGRGQLAKQATQHLEGKPTNGNSATLGSKAKVREDRQRDGTASCSAGQRRGVPYRAPKMEERSKHCAYCPSTPPTSPLYRPRIASFRPNDRKHSCRRDWGLLRDADELFQRHSCDVLGMQRRAICDLYNLYTDCSGSPGKLQACVPCSSGQYWRNSCGSGPEELEHPCITERIPRHMVERMEPSGTVFCVSNPKKKYGNIRGGHYVAARDCGTHRSSWCEQATLSRLRAQVQCSRVHRNMEAARELLEERSALLSS